MDYGYSASYSYSTSSDSPVGSFIWILVGVVMLVASWKIFEKAGVAGWKSLVPFYNMYLLVQIVGKPTWWFLLMFVPFANLVVYVLIQWNLARVFGKSDLFGLGLIFLPPVFMLMLGFGQDTYKGHKIA